MKPCFGYIRVSTQKQGEGVSLIAQKDAIQAFAVLHGFAITEWFEEKETAAKSGRPIFNRMLKALKRGAASGLIMHKIDRSARNLRDWAIISELPDAGIDVYIATESYDFRSRGGRLTADIQAVIAADYIRNLREETIKGLTGRLKQGLYPFRAPIGYLDNGRGKPKTICPEKGPIIREAFLSYARGEFSMRALQEELERRGLRNHAGKPLSLHGIETILGNPFYCGIIEIKRTGQTYQGIHERLIDAKTFARVQDVRAGRAGKKLTRHCHLYRGLFRCGLCDRPMSPERQKGIVYYRCQNPRCTTKTVREDSLEVAIYDCLQALEFRKEEADELRDRWLDWIGSAGRQGRLKMLDLSIEKKQDRLNRLTDLLVDGALDRKDFERRKNALEIELGELESERVETAKNDLPPDKMEKFIELMKNLAELHGSAMPDEKRHLVQNVFSNRTVVEKSVVLEPFDWLLNREFSDLSPLVTHVDTLIELSPKNSNNDHPGPVPKWKHNLKNQRPDDLQNTV